MLYLPGRIVNSSDTVQCWTTNTEYSESFSSGNRAMEGAGKLATNSTP